MKHILVIGGAGYIGSHMSRMLTGRGYAVTILDNLCNGHVQSARYGQFIRGGAGDGEILDSLFAKTHFDAVMHFASRIQVGESVSHPGLYYRNNVVETQQLLDRVVAHQIPAFVFSSSAAVYGEPQIVPIPESHPKSPTSPYGRSKWMIEQMLEDYALAYGLNSASLRYFNAAGADPDGVLCEMHHPETHLIPLVLQAASGLRDGIQVFGDDYDTPDGTCIRDYVHVHDLCTAHLLAMKQLWSEGGCHAYNLGNGQGYSVRQVLETVNRIVGGPILVEHADRRPGDPARLVADASQAKSVLGWEPAYPELDTIVEHAWRALRKTYALAS